MESNINQQEYDTNSVPMIDKYGANDVDVPVFKMNFTAILDDVRDFEDLFFNGSENHDYFRKEEFNVIFERLKFAQFSREHANHILRTFHRSWNGGFELVAATPNVFVIDMHELTGRYDSSVFALMPAVSYSQVKMEFETSVSRYEDKNVIIPEARLWDSLVRMLYHERLRPFYREANKILSELKKIHKTNFDYEPIEVPKHLVKIGLHQYKFDKEEGE